jgi:hypothetical protein
MPVQHPARLGMQDYHIDVDHIGAVVVVGFAGAGVSLLEKYIKW